MSTSPVSTASIPSPIGRTVEAPVVALTGADGTKRVNRWVESVTTTWTAQGGRSVRVSADDRPNSVFHQRLLTTTTTDAVTSHLSGKVSTLLVLDLTGVLDHSGPHHDEHATAALTEAIRDATLASRDVGGLSLILVARSPRDLPPTLPPVVTLVTAAAPSPDLMPLLDTPQQGSKRPAQEPPKGHLWRLRGGDSEWSALPVSEPRST